MKIAKLETFDTPFVCFVKVTADTGDVGWGQTSTYQADITAEIFHRQVAPYALGTAVEDLEDTLRRIFEREHKFPGSYLRRAQAGLDTAVWDLRGTRGGQACRLAAGRIARQSARLCQFDEARHHARG